MQTTTAPATADVTVEYLIEEFLPGRGTWLTCWGGEGPRSFGYLSHEQDARDKACSLECEEEHLPEADRAQYRVLRKVTVVTTDVIS